MKMIKLIPTLALASIVLFQAFSFAPTENATEIIKKVYKRKSPKSGESDMKMTLVNKKGKTRVRVLHQFFKDYGTVEKKIMFFKTPADVKNTSFMTWSYDDETKDDDQWLYLPALKKVKRISNSNKDNDFMGSDFTYEDMENRNPNRDTHKYIKTVKYKNEICYVIELTPKKEEQYSKRVAYIIKDKWIPIKVDFYDEDEALLKTLNITGYKNITGYWIITSQKMSNKQKNHQTTINISNVKVDVGVSDAMISQRAMAKGL
jgi:outer membrane lipoprotein-sorting protein